MEAVPMTTRWIARAVARFAVGLTLGLAALALGAGTSAADVYDLDSEHTEVRFSWDHLGMSRQSGRFTDVKGIVDFNANNPAASTVNVTIPLKSIQTGVKKLDDHLLNSREFFNPDTYPEIAFRSVSVTPTGARTAEVTGDLTMNGVSRPVVLDVIWNFSGEHPLSAINPTYAGVYASGFSAKTQIRRSDWGLTRTIPFVSDEIRITIETEMHRRSLPIVADPALTLDPAGDTATAGEASVPSSAPEVPTVIPVLPGAVERLP
jgi:polyisoprenoid-binding protein YceI